MFHSAPKSKRSTAPRDERGAAGELALEIIHEIRNPLEALSYLNFLALDDVENPEQVQKYLHLAQEQIETLTRVASQTLGFSQLASSAKKIDFVDVAEAALRIHQRTIAARKIHLVKELPDSLLTEGHAGRMLQALSNLIVNALEALPDGGKLSIRLSKRQGHLHLLVADNGPGIAREHQDRIFEQFFTTKGEAGNGMGLALSKRIVEEHNGKLSFRTAVRAGRTGTAFKICFPA